VIKLRLQVVGAPSPVCPPQRATRRKLNIRRQNHVSRVPGMRSSDPESRHLKVATEAVKCTDQSYGVVLSARLGGRYDATAAGEATRPTVVFRPKPARGREDGRNADSEVHSPGARLRSRSDACQPRRSTGANWTHHVRGSDPRRHQLPSAHASHDTGTSVADATIQACHEPSHGRSPDRRRAVWRVHRIRLRPPANHPPCSPRSAAVATRLARATWLDLT
jgi:hypothetical protein